MPLAPNPMEAFTMGQSIGKANSPVTGIGLAIQNVVDDARKRGLLKAESIYGAQATDSTNVLKENREEARLTIPKDTIFAGKTAEEDRTITAPRGSDVKSAPAEDATAAAIREVFSTSGGSSPTLDIKASAFLKSNNAQDTPANREAVIKRGLVK